MAMTPDEFAERFKRLRSSEDRYRYLIQLGRKLEPYPEEFRDQEHLVPGCLSQVWLVTVEGSERSEVVFRADSDAHIVKGLIAVLLMMYNGKTPEEILSTDVEGLFKRLELEAASLGQPKERLLLDDPKNERTCGPSGGHLLR